MFAVKVIQSIRLYCNSRQSFASFVPLLQIMQKIKHHPVSSKWGGSTRVRRPRLRQPDQQLPQILGNLDGLLLECYSSLPASRFHSLLLSATREIFSNIQKQFQEGDSGPLEESVSVLEKWVDEYCAGGEIASTLFLAKAMYYGQAGDTQTAQSYIERAKHAIEETSSSYFLCRVLTIEGDVLFSGKPDEAMDAYRSCITYCQKASLVTSNQHILEQFKTALIICNYKLALLERLDKNDNETILKYLCESARSARDLFGEDSPVFQRFEQYYFEEERKKKKAAKEGAVLIKVHQQEEGDRHLIYEGPISCIENGHRGSGDITISYRADTKELEAEFRKGSKGRKEKIQVSENIDIPLASLPDLGKKIHWISVVNNKIQINHEQIRKMLSQEQKQYRTFLKQVGRDEMFDDKDVPSSDQQPDRVQTRNTAPLPLLSSLKNLAAFSKHASLNK